MGQQVAKAKRTVRTPQAYVGTLEQALERKATAPRHPSTVKQFEKLVAANPNFKVSVQTKNEELHKRLESVRVDSQGAAPDMILKAVQKKLEHPRDGRLTFDEIEELFIKHKVQPETWNEALIAEKYKLEPNVVENLLKYYGAFYIYKGEEKSILDASFFLSKPDHLNPVLQDGKGKDE